MPEKKRYYELKEKSICTECAKRKATCNTRCERCYKLNQSRKVLLGLSKPITSQEYKALKESQNYSCAICGIKENGQALALDHSHVTGLVRGFLCSSCNRGLGLFHDSIERLSLAVKYLQKFEAVQ